MGPLTSIKESANRGQGEAIECKVTKSIDVVAAAVEFVQEVNEFHSERPEPTISESEWNRNVPSL